jgi:hypothetical protein
MRRVGAIVPAALRCENCGNSVIRGKRGPVKRFCSTECRVAAREVVGAESGAVRSVRRRHAWPRMHGLGGRSTRSRTRCSRCWSRRVQRWTNDPGRLHSLSNIAESVATFASSIPGRPPATWMDYSAITEPRSAGEHHERGHDRIDSSR